MSQNQRAEPVTSSAGAPLEVDSTFLFQSARRDRG
jgi:hypothetical protein